MQEDKSVMRYESVLPPDFDGTFKFTNPSDEDFIGVWGSKEYLFPSETTSPMIMTEYSPLEIQHIRKKFAKDLAEREFYKSKSYKMMSGQEGKPGNRTMNSIHQAATYTLTDLEPYIKACLKPLKGGVVTVKAVEGFKIEDKLSRNEEGELNSEAISAKSSLRKKALEA
jgi:hypothetical protein